MAEPITREELQRLRDAAKKYQEVNRIDFPGAQSTYLDRMDAERNIRERDGEARETYIDSLRFYSAIATLAVTPEALTQVQLNIVAKHSDLYLNRRIMRQMEECGVSDELLDKLAATPPEQIQKMATEFSRRETSGMRRAQ